MASVPLLYRPSSAHPLQTAILSSIQLYNFFAPKISQLHAMVSQSTQGLLPQQGPTHYLEIMVVTLKSLFLFLTSVVSQISLFSL